MRVLMASAELAPYVRVGGLAEAVGGLSLALRELGVTLDVVVPDYFGADVTLGDEETEVLHVPSWVGGATARTGTLADFGTVTLVSAPGLERPFPYGEPGTFGWPDNDRRFMAFSAGVAALVKERKVDVLHANDWHTGASLAFVGPATPSVFSIHNLAYQGQCHIGWLEVLGEFGEDRKHAYQSHGECNPMVGALRLADAIVAVSPGYAKEILTPDGGAGVEGILLDRGEAVFGILNGIDTAAWNPGTDPFLAENYGPTSLKTGSGAGKDACRAALRLEAGLPAIDGPVIGVVTRLVDQKGVDLVVEAAQFMASLDAQLVVLGAGDPELVAGLRQRMADQPDRISFREGFDLGYAHRIFSGSDLFVMPSRFEPCGLAQMQAMAYGTIPVVTGVGGVGDTVIDADRDHARGNGFVSEAVTAAGVVDALHRAVRSWKVKKRRASIMANGMSTDWSWTGPARRYLAVYEAIRTRNRLTNR